MDAVSSRCDEIRRRTPQLPSAGTHGIDYGGRRNAIQVSRPGADWTVASLLGNYANIAASCSKFCRTAVTQAVGMHALLDTCLGCQTFDQGSNVSRRHRLAVERAENGLTTVDAELLSAI